MLIFLETPLLDPMLYEWELMTEIEVCFDFILSLNKCYNNFIIIGLVFIKTAVL